MNIKNLLKAALKIGLFVLLSPFILVILFATSLIWVPFVLLFSTPLAVTYLVLQKTPLGSQMKAFYAKDIKERIEASGGLQYFIVENLNIILCLVFPKLQRKTNNYGYAVLNQDGKLISDIKVEFEDERFPLQLYHYLATSFERYRNLGKWNVLELECEMGGGLEYISKTLKARRSVGITSDDRKAKFCQKNYHDTKLEFLEAGIDQLLQDDLLKGQKFDLILNIEGRSRFGLQKVQEMTKIAENLLRPGGIFVCSDYGTKAEMAQMESELANCSLKMVKKENLTVNILHGFKLDKRRKQGLRNISSVYEWVRAAFLKLHSKERVKLEVNFREDESVYYAYLLRKD